MSPKFWQLSREAVILAMGVGVGMCFRVDQWVGFGIFLSTALVLALGVTKGPR